MEEQGLHVRRTLAHADSSLEADHRLEADSRLEAEPGVVVVVVLHKQG